MVKCVSGFERHRWEFSGVRISRKTGNNVYLYNCRRCSKRIGKWERRGKWKNK